MMQTAVVIDGEMTTYAELFRLASELNSEFGSDGFRLSSEAAKILRDNGYTVCAVM